MAQPCLTSRAIHIFYSPFPSCSSENITSTSRQNSNPWPWGMVLSAQGLPTFICPHPKHILISACQTAVNPGLVYFPRNDTLILPKFALPHVTGTPWRMHRGLALISLIAVIITLVLYLGNPSLRDLVSSPCHNLALGRAWNWIEL